MDVELQINNSVDPNKRFVGWVPSPCRVRVTNPAGSIGPTASIKLTSVSASTTAGAVVFRAGTSGAFVKSLTLTVPTNGASVVFFVAGKFGRPSQTNGDVKIEARRGTTLVGSVSLMVRVRKNANGLSTGERDRFLSALAQLNAQGMGRFQDFRDIHTDESDPQAHGFSGFLPWHRAYLLDLERELQVIDSAVTLPYWRFDAAAPNIFSTAFMGQSNAAGTVQFSPTNPLRFWVTDTVPGIVRLAEFNTATQSAFVSSQATTLGLGTTFKLFRDMEGDPHGFAHTSFHEISFIRHIGTAARDPLFFMLHCNVDRLWALWQRNNNRFNHAVAASYDTNPTNPIGHRLPDTMWPWNGVTGFPRPATAPGGDMASSLIVTAPGGQPRVQDCLDYQGAANAAAKLGFDYDDVRFA